MGKPSADVEGILRDAVDRSLLWVIQSAIYFSKWDTSCGDPLCHDLHTANEHSKDASELGALIDGLAMGCINGHYPIPSQIIELSSFITDEDGDPQPVMVWSKINTPAKLEIAQLLTSTEALQTVVLLVGAMANYARITDHAEWIMPSVPQAPQEESKLESIVAALRAIGVNLTEDMIEIVNLSDKSPEEAEAMLQAHLQESMVKKIAHDEEDREIRLSDMPPLVSTDDLRGEEQ